MRKFKKLIAGTALTLVLMGFAPSAGAACGGCFCSPGSGEEGGYACVELGGYTRWLKIAE